VPSSLSLRLYLVALLCSVVISPSFADPRCDCAYNKVQGGCTAVIERKRDWVEISTPGLAQCSSVIWDISGYAQVSVVTDGHISEPLISVPNDAKIEIRSCKICQDANYPNQQQSKRPPDDSSSTQATSMNAPPSATGSWTGYTTSFFGRQDASLQIAVHGTSISGTYLHPKMGSIPLTGSIVGTTMTLNCATADGPMTWTLQVNGDNLTGAWRSGMFSGSVQMNRR